MATKIKIITNFDSKEDQATRKTTLKPTNLYEEAQRRYDELLQVKRMTRTVSNGPRIISEVLKNTVFRL